MCGKTKTFKIVYYDNNVKSGDTRRSTFVEAYDRSDAIYRFQQEYGNSVVVRDCMSYLFKQPRLMSKKEERVHLNDGHALGLFGFGG